MSVGLSVQDLMTPVAVIDETVMETNIKVAQEYFDRIGRNFRPHIKTHKIRRWPHCSWPMAHAVSTARK